MLLHWKKYTAICLLLINILIVELNALPKVTRKNVLNEGLSNTSPVHPKGSLRASLDSLLRGMELSDLKRSLDDKLAAEIAEVDSSIFPGNEDRDAKKTPPSLTEVSAHAHIPPGALVRRDASASENEIKKFLGMTTSDNKKNAPGVFPPPGEIERKRSEIKKLADGAFLKRLFAEADKAENKRQVDQKKTPMLPKETEDERQVKEETPMLPNNKKKDEIPKFLKDAIAVDEKVSVNAEKKRQVTVNQKTPMLAQKTEDKRQLNQETPMLPNNKKNEIPKFLKDAIAVDEKKREASNEVDKKLMKEFSVNKVYQTFGHQEKKTVDKFVSALKMISEEETKLKLKRELNKLELKKKEAPRVLYAIEDNEKCVDEEKDCESYKTFCHDYPKQMKLHCRKTCGFCTTGCGPNHGSDALCNMIKTRGYCKQPTAQINCAATCQCEECKNSIYGCCWDKKTMKDDPTGINCPECKNKYTEEVCSMFQQDCHSTNQMTKKWMRSNCMETCGLCKSKNLQAGHPNGIGSGSVTPCEDDKQQAEFCPLWHNAGWCADKVEIMEKFCPKTCFGCRKNYLSNYK